MVVESIIQSVIFGLIEGGLLALGAVGFSLVFGLVGVINFAYGDYMTTGAYTTFVLVGVLGSGLTAFFFSIVVTMVLVGILGVVFARVFFKPLRDRNPLSVFLTSLAIAFLLRNLLRLQWGDRPQLYGLPLLRSINLGPFLIPPTNLAIGVFSVLIVLGLFGFTQYTRWGKALRALSDNREMARAYGIPTERYISVAWFISSAFAGLAGVFLGIIVDVTPRLGWDFFLVMFASVVLGGIGSLPGAVVGAFIIGIAMNVSSLFLPSGYQTAIAFAIMVVVLLSKPEGIFGGA